LGCDCNIFSTRPPAEDQLQRSYGAPQPLRSPLPRLASSSLRALGNLGAISQTGAASNDHPSVFPSIGALTEWRGPLSLRCCFESLPPPSCTPLRLTPHCGCCFSAERSVSPSAILLSPVSKKEIVLQPSISLFEHCWDWGAL